MSVNKQEINDIVRTLKEKYNFINVEANEKGVLNTITNETFAIGGIKETGFWVNTTDDENGVRGTRYGNTVLIIKNYLDYCGVN